MTSIFGSRNRHLDTSGGREVVFCHACRHEWYRDPHQDLHCPSCGSEITEIVEAASDPREEREFPLPLPPFGRFDRNRPFDSDPEEDDLDNHIPSPFSQPRPTPRQGNGGPGDGDAVLRRFADMLMNDLGGARQTRGGPESLFPPRPGDDPGPFGLFATGGDRANGSPTRTVHRTFRSGPVTGSATFTIISSGNRPADEAFPPTLPGFPSLFGHILSNATPPNNDDPMPFGRNPSDGPPPNGGDPNRATGANPQGPRYDRPLPQFHELLASLLNPAAAVHGDAVYTQEALDRIITSLMENNTQSNAAPPASQAAIDSLEKKRVDDKMLGVEGKAECTICMDEIPKGEEVTVLPCTHWFHGECVTLWLKEHNTCPICRASIDQRGSQSSSSQPTPQPASPQSATPSSAFPASSSIFGGSGSRSERRTRTLRENQQRLDAIRNMNNMNPTSYIRADGSVSSTRGDGRLDGRRNSMSPVNSRRDNPYRSRDRSPSSSRDQDAGVSPYDRGAYYPASTARETGETRDRSSQSTQSSSHGPLSWLRDHLGRSSGNGSDRDRRR
ncbi:hypothetical protein QBC47DRAFT_401960 [Echria macrotheca]|uniref:RING-type E3 ubiquitin transferase n=1 Tax=Echria macrotheca TaxID=438768 RepID=A0AAJ0BH64_9PEZI|nr:hypothetical protein QBC47DRAFT_401960 [Echria macrotheca]